MINKEGFLAIDVYNRNETEGRVGLSNRFIRAFTPGLFERGGFPTKVLNEAELKRYIDSQHSECFEKYYNVLCRGITTDEKDMMVDLTKTLYQITCDLYESKFLVKAPVLAALKCYRVLEALCEKHNECRVLEVGAGSGIFGAMLLQKGWKYLCTDVTQAFYLIQNRILNSISDIKEFGGGCSNENDLEGICVHIPYWKLWEYRNKIKNVDIVVCNRALLEMHPNAIRFYLKLSIQAMKESRYGYFVFQGAGWNVDLKLEELLELFREYGFKIVYFNRNDEVVVFQTCCNDDCYAETIEMLKNKDLIKFDDMYVYGIGNVEKVLTTSYEAIYSESGKKIYSKLREIDLTKKIKIEELQKEYDKISSEQDSPDEEFAKYIFD